MGQSDVKDAQSAELRAFMQAVLSDLQALERMIDEGQIESGVRRIGAEQEMFLVDRDWQVKNIAPTLLQGLGTDHFTKELAQFNLEANASPHELSASCLSDLHRELDQLVGEAAASADRNDAHVILCGILPTLTQDDLGLDSMTPSERYAALNRVMTELRGGEFQSYIKGLDELQVHHDNVMLEAANTSFQLHFQVGAEEFAKLYNLAQVVTGPVLAAAVNSPVLLQHRLWHETRVALFQQSLDIRSKAKLARGSRQRVSFGERWVESSVLEIFREDIARFRALLTTNLPEDPMAVLDRGEIPGLDALRLQNGTVYRWNRPCYGISNGKPHLRIENRVLPAGPTIVDEIANAAFYFGLMISLGEEHARIQDVFSFDHAAANFLGAARYGLDAQFRWIGGRAVPARTLILEELIPASRAGLLERGIDSGDVEQYLGIIEERVRSEKTGSRWALDSLAAMPAGSPDERHRALVAAMAEGQKNGQPVHTWGLARLGARKDKRGSLRTVGRIMTRDVFTVHPEDVIDLAANLMEWEHIRRIPVEDDDGHLVGLLTQRGLLRLVTRKQTDAEPVAVREVMRLEPITVTPTTPTLEAIRLMREHRVGCLPVVDDGRLVGIVTEHDFVQLASELLEDMLVSDD